MTKLFDVHYNKERVEQIDIQEQIMECNINIPVKSRHLLSTSIKYPIRAGLKEGEDWKKDVIKSINYQFRALTGCWLNEMDLNEYFHDDE